MTIIEEIGMTGMTGVIEVEIETRTIIEVVIKIIVIIGADLRTTEIITEVGATITTEEST